MSTTECSCRLWPSPGMYVVTSMPFDKRTRATLRSAEFGFYGVVVYTRVHTPRFCGQSWSAGDAVLAVIAWRPLRMSWLMVGMGSRKKGHDPGARGGGRLPAAGLVSSQILRQKLNTKREERLRGETT